MELMHILGGFHGIIASILAIAIIYTDHHGWQYFRGTRQTLSVSFVTWSHRLIWVGLLLMISTGVLLAIPRYEYLLGEAAFYVKMGFVAVLIVNAFAIGGLSKVATTTPYAALPTETKRTLLTSGMLSGMGWVCAALIGLFFL